MRSAPMCGYIIWHISIDTARRVLQNVTWVMRNLHPPCGWVEDDWHPVSQRVSQWWSFFQTVRGMSDGFHTEFGVWFQLIWLFWSIVEVNFFSPEHSTLRQTLSGLTEISSLLLFNYVNPGSHPGSNWRSLLQRTVDICTKSPHIFPIHAIWTPTAEAVRTVIGLVFESQ